MGFAKFSFVLRLVEKVEELQTDRNTCKTKKTKKIELNTKSGKGSSIMTSQT